MGTGVRDKYNIAINQRGYILRGSPQNPAYSRSVMPSQVDRLAISDLAYSDFAGQGMFYLAQSDWSNGIKHESLWRDDAKYYYSTNIDAYSAGGEIKAAKNVALDETFDDEISCGVSCQVAGSVSSFLGTNQDTNDIRVYKLAAGIWGDIIGGSIPSQQTAISFLVGNSDKLFIGTIGSGDNYVVSSYNGSTLTDHSAAIEALLTGWVNLRSARAACEVAGKLYIAVDDTTGGDFAFVSTADGGANWVLVKDFGYREVVISMVEYLGEIFYLTYNSNGGVMNLRHYDIVNDIDGHVWQFNNATSPAYGVNDRMLKVYNGKLIITIPNSTLGDIYQYDGTDLTSLYSIDEKKQAIGQEAGIFLYYGAVAKKNKLYWGNLIYDGEAFFNNIKPTSDTATHYLYPIFADNSENLYYKSSDSYYELYNDTTTYKPTLASNYLVLNEMSPVASIDKLLYSITLLFDALATGDQIKVDYSINNRASWVTAGTLTPTTEGSNTKREIFIPNNVVFSKIWLKISIANSLGTRTPVVLDAIIAYKPMPNYKNQWNMRLNMSDSVKLLSNQSEQFRGQELCAQLWNYKLLKQKVLLEDIDYAEVTLRAQMSSTATSASVNTVYRLPRQGRLRVVSGGVSEEMYYTSADGSTVKGIVRGQRGTRARTYPSGSTLKNDFDVYIDDITTDINFTDEKKSEFVAQVRLIEA